MNKERVRYFYVVAGMYDGNGDDISYTILNNNHSLFTNKEKAKQELREILQEIQQDAEENEFTFEHYFTNNDESLQIVFETGTEERYNIYKVKLN